MRIKHRVTPTEFQMLFNLVLIYRGTVATLISVLPLSLLNGKIITVITVINSFIRLTIIGHSFNHEFWPNPCTHNSYLFLFRRQFFRILF